MVWSHAAYSVLFWCYFLKFIFFSVLDYLSVFRRKMFGLIPMFLITKRYLWNRHISETFPMRKTAQLHSCNSTGLWLSAQSLALTIWLLWLGQISPQTECYTRVVGQWYRIWRIIAVQFFVGCFQTLSPEWCFCVSIFPVLWPFGLVLTVQSRLFPKTAIWNTSPNLCRVFKCR